MCDFDDDFGDGFEDDGFEDGEPFDDDLAGEEHYQDDAHEAPLTDISGGLDWQDIALLGALSEELAEEKRRREQIRREAEKRDH